MKKQPGKAVVRAGQVDPGTGRKALPGTGAPGPGRPKGVPNRKIKETRQRAQDILQRILKNGPTPLEIMWKMLKFPWVCRNCDHLSETRFKICPACEAKPIKVGKGLVYPCVRNFDASLLEAAKAAAPYVHPRLQQITLSGHLGITHEEALARLDRLDAGDEIEAEEAEYVIEEDDEAVVA